MIMFTIIIFGLMIELFNFFGDYIMLNGIDEEEDVEEDAKEVVEEDVEEEHKNKCTVCEVDMGPSNPRQLCGKTYCMFDNDIDDDDDDDDSSTYTLLDSTIDYEEERQEVADVVDVVDDDSYLLSKEKDTTMHIIKKAINSRIHNSVIGACWALSLMTEKNDVIDCQISDIIASGIAPQLIGIIRYKDNDIIEPTIRTIGNIIMHSDNDLTQVLIDAGLIETLVYLLEYNSSRKIKQEVCFIISNIACEGSEQCHELIDRGAISIIINIFNDIYKNSYEEYKNNDNIWYHILHTLNNVACFQTSAQITYLINKDIVVLCCSIIEYIQNTQKTASKISVINQVTHDDKSICIILDILGNIIESCNNGINYTHRHYVISSMYRTIDTFNTIQKRINNTTIANKASMIYRVCCEQMKCVTEELLDTNAPFYPIEIPTKL